MKHTARIELANNDQLVLANAGIMSPEDGRRVIVEDALVDTGATRLGLPPSLIELRYNLRFWNAKESLPSWAYLKVPLFSLDISY